MKDIVSDVMDDLFNYYNPATRSVTPMISPVVHDVIVKHAERINSAIIYDRDYLYNYFGFKASLLMTWFNLDGFLLSAQEEVAPFTPP